MEKIVNKKNGIWKKWDKNFTRKIICFKKNRVNLKKKTKRFTFAWMATLWCACVCAHFVRALVTIVQLWMLWFSTSILKINQNVPYIKRKKNPRSKSTCNVRIWKRNGKFIEDTKKKENDWASGCKRMNKNNEKNIHRER